MDEYDAKPSWQPVGALSERLTKLIESLQGLFENVDKVEPRHFENGCTIESCSLTHAKNTDGIRRRLDPPVELLKADAQAAAQLDFYFLGPALDLSTDLPFHCGCVCGALCLY